MQFGIPITIIRGGIKPIINEILYPIIPIVPNAQTTVTNTTNTLIKVTLTDRKRKYIKREEIKIDRKMKMYISFNTRLPICTRMCGKPEKCTSPK